MERIIKSVLIIVPIIGCLAYVQYHEQITEVNSPSISVEEGSIEWTTLQEGELMPQQGGTYHTDPISIMNQRFY